MNEYIDLIYLMQGLFSILQGWQRLVDLIVGFLII